ncbi:carbonic anhydrase 2-like isoform X2 [Microplitis mediator]|uniref:carbonic anhydrase 2-like isoform X2 n=1 Tax=Microplitis mediator TaxID=375433 RepID=UPI002556652E|nr:carbonic anhydrase 2-like isoform X2 [Microplitis mediator]
MIFIFNIILVSLRMLVISADYNYKDPDTWKEQYPHCGGSEQSPIDVTVLNQIKRKNFEDVYTKIWLQNYKTVPAKMTMKNNGHSLKIMFEWAEGETKIPTIFGGPLESEYIFHSLEFHWGPDINSGSEHTFMGKSYPIELQLIHYDFEFDNLEAAERYEKGVTIYSTFFKVESDESAFLTKILEKIPDVIDSGTETEIEPFAIDDLLQEKDANSFIVYHGSQTSPSCLESVNWLISDQVFSATREQKNFSSFI